MSTMSDSHQEEKKEEAAEVEGENGPNSSSRLKRMELLVTKQSKELQLYNLQLKNASKHMTNQHVKLCHQVTALQADLVAAEVSRQAGEDDLQRQLQEKDQQLVQLQKQLLESSVLRWEMDRSAETAAVKSQKEICNRRSQEESTLRSGAPLVIDVTTHDDQMLNHCLAKVEQQQGCCCGHSSSLNDDLENRFQKLEQTIQQNSANQLVQHKHLQRDVTKCKTENNKQIQKVVGENACISAALEEMAVEWDTRLFDLSKQIQQQGDDLCAIQDKKDDVCMDRVAALEMELLRQIQGATGKVQEWIDNSSRKQAEDLAAMQDELEERMQQQANAMRKAQILHQSVDRRQRKVELVTVIQEEMAAFMTKNEGAAEKKVNALSKQVQDLVQRVDNSLHDRHIQGERLQDIERNLQALQTDVRNVKVQLQQQHDYLQTVTFTLRDQNDQSLHRDGHVQALQRELQQHQQELQQQQQDLLAQHCVKDEVQSMVDAWNLQHQTLVQQMQTLADEFKASNQPSPDKDLQEELKKLKEVVETDLKSMNAQLRESKWENRGLHRTLQGKSDKYKQVQNQQLDCGPPPTTQAATVTSADLALVGSEE